MNREGGAWMGIAVARGRVTVERGQVPDQASPISPFDRSILPASQLRPAHKEKKS